MCIILFCLLHVLILCIVYLCILCIRRSSLWLLYCNKRVWNVNTACHSRSTCSSAVLRYYLCIVQRAAVTVRTWDWWSRGRVLPTIGRSTFTWQTALDKLFAHMRTKLYNFTPARSHSHCQLTTSRPTAPTTAFQGRQIPEQYDYCRYFAIWF